MSFTLLHHTAASAVSPSSSVTTTAIDTTGAALLAAFVVFDHGTVPSFADSIGNLYTQAPFVWGEEQLYSGWYYCIGPKTSVTHTVTLTVSGSAYASISFRAYSCSGAVVGLSVDHSNSGYSPTAVTSAQLAAIIPSNDGELILCGLASWPDTTATDFAVDSGLTIQDQIDSDAVNYYGIAVADFIQSVAALINPTWTTANAAYVSENIISFWTYPVTASFSVVQHGCIPSDGSYHAATSTISFTPPNPITRGNMLILACYNFDVDGSYTVTSIADTLLNPGWIQKTPKVTDESGSSSVEIWASVIFNSGSDTITVTWPNYSGDPYPAVYWVEVSGIGLSGNYGTGAFTYAVPLPIQTNSFSTPVNNFIFVFEAHNGFGIVLTPYSGYSTIDTQPFNAGDNQLISFYGLNLPSPASPGGTVSSGATLWVIAAISFVVAPVKSGAYVFLG